MRERVNSKQAQMRKKLDSIRKKLTKDELHPGTVVMIKDPLYLLNPSMRPTTQPMWIGPYTIVRRTLYGPYLLRDDTGIIYQRLVNIDQMKVVYSADKVAPINDNNNDDKEEDYVVDFIVKHREIEGRLEYLTRWKGYSAKDDTWEPEDNYNDYAPIERYFKLLVAKSQSKKIKMNLLNADNVVLHLQEDFRRSQ